MTKASVLLFVAALVDWLVGFLGAFVPSELVNGWIVFSDHMSDEERSEI